MLGNLLNNLTATLRGQPWFRQLTAFLGWWRTQLVTSLPPQVQRFLAAGSVRLLARLDDGEVVLWRNARQTNEGGSGEPEELGRFAIDADNDVARQAVLTALGRFDGETPQTFFLVAEDEVLVHQFKVPAAAEENLRQVLAFEMDKNTPFTADQVCFDFRVIERLDAHLRVELVAVTRPQIERIHRSLAERGLALHGIDVTQADSDGHAQLMGVNLLADDQRAQVNQRQLKINFGLAALAVLLLYGVMWQSLVARQQAIEEFQVRTNQARIEAQKVSELRSELAAARQAASFLSEAKASNPVVMNVMKSVTTAMPDDVWIQRMQVTQGKVQLTGQATEASSLISLLGEAPCLKDPAPKGAFTPDAKSGKERFTIEVFVDCNGEENGSVSAG